MSFSSDLSSNLESRKTIKSPQTWVLVSAFNYSKVFHPFLHLLSSQRGKKFLRRTLYYLPVDPHLCRQPYPATLSFTFSKTLIRP